MAARCNFLKNVKTFHYPEILQGLAAVKETVWISLINVLFITQKQIYSILDVGDAWKSVIKADQTDVYFTPDSCLLQL